ncbi:arrestin domain-containing protein 4 isoform X4 [Microplitis demolitor]|uniref:arrestin domain-containing protein 4 isoform X4 n=1 Tax=Microplitis demolitor TaxID=69319 RepID=UPI0004CCA71D|nr:arrestin domain-containing protein 4 isoform X4 [Microplitis demolitor]
MTRKLSKFIILFDNTNLLYFPGHFLSGRVLIELDDETCVSGLHFHVIGEGVVRVRSQRAERVYDKENYIDFRMRLLGEPGESASFLSPGIHSFPFKLGLPLGLPSTFLGKHGWVQYYCKAALREPGGLTHKNQQVFIVMNPIDLNLEPPILAQPARLEVEQRVGVSCVSSGPIFCRVSLDRGGYVPGETIGISATVSNRSKFVISPKGLDKEIKLQIPIILATYPLRQEGGLVSSTSSKRGAHYPSTLPIFRPWLDDKALEVEE